MVTDIVKGLLVQADSTPAHEGTGHYSAMVTASEMRR